MYSPQLKNTSESKQSCGRMWPVVQPKLTVNRPGDIYEQEADAMADRVMRMSADETFRQPQPATGLIGRSIQRKCPKCEEEEKKKPIMRKAENGAAGIPVSSSFASSLNASKGGGSPLPGETRNFMEHAFSADFSQVRVHTNNQASELSKGINAKAFTTGNNIYFNEGEYNPTSADGKHLLAHELTHTVQQNKTSTLYRWFKGTDRVPVPQGTTIHVGALSSAQWLQAHRNAGNPFSEAISFVLVMSSLSSQTTTNIATRCNQQSSFSDKIICLHNEVHSAVLELEGSDGDLNDGDYVCRNYAAAVHDVSQQMGLSPDWETSTTHAWIEFTNNGRQYVVDAYNQILYSYPIQ